MDTNIGKMIRDIAVYHRLSLRQLAFRMGISAQAIQSLIKREGVSKSSLKKIEMATGDELFIGWKPKDKNKINNYKL